MKKPEPSTTARQAIARARAAVNDFWAQAGDLEANPSNPATARSKLHKVNPLAFVVANKIVEILNDSAATLTDAGSDFNANERYRKARQKMSDGIFDALEEAEL